MKMKNIHINKMLILQLRTLSYTNRMTFFPIQKNPIVSLTKIRCKSITKKKRKTIKKLDKNTQFSFTFT